MEEFMANIVNTRIDERLVHGQIVAFWTNRLNATRIMVIDDQAAGNDIQKAALKMACPAGTKLSILRTERALEKLSDPNNYKGERLLVVFRGPSTLKNAVDKGYPEKNITVGNMSSRIGSHRIFKSTSVTDEDIVLFREMANNGMTFTAQMVPDDKPENFIDLIAKY
jgi:PTS system mannose-specific IIB component